MPLKRKAAVRRKSAGEPKKKKQKTEDTADKPKTTKKTKSPATISKKSETVGIKDLITDQITDKLWKVLLSKELEEEYFQELEQKMKTEYDAKKEIFPPRDQIFNAFKLTPVDKVKLVILGQDPYHDNGQAMGLSFSVPHGIAVPPSLRNMYKELNRDPKVAGFKIPDHGCLENWAKQGVLLLNATLTVEAHKPNSHSKFGWQKFTDNVMKAISEHCDHIVFLLYGGFAHKKEKLIDTKKHAIVKTAHPSPLSFNKFMGCNCFSDCNEALKKFGLSPIDWSL